MLKQFTPGETITVYSGLRGAEQAEIVANDGGMITWKYQGQPETYLSLHAVLAEAMNPALAGAGNMVVMNGGW